MTRHRAELRNTVMRHVKRGTTAGTVDATLLARLLTANKQIDGPSYDKDWDPTWNAPPETDKERALRRHREKEIEQANKATMRNDTTAASFKVGNFYRFSNVGTIHIKRIDADGNVVADLIKHMPMEMSPNQEMADNVMMVEISIPSEVARNLLTPEEQNAEIKYGPVAMSQAYVSCDDDGNILDQLEMSIKITDHDIRSFIAKNKQVVIVTYDTDGEIMDALVIK